MKRSRVLVVGIVAVLAAACAHRPPFEQRTSQGPTAETLFTYHVATQNGREPTFDEKRHWEDQIDLRIDQYLRQHPEAANSLDVSTFRFLRQVTISMTKEQVLILLGAPTIVTADQGEMEKLASRYWPDIKGNATEAWVYPLGWRLFFAGLRLIDITQYVER